MKFTRGIIMDPIIIAVCALSTVCAGLILIGLVLALRFTKSSFMKPVMTLLMGTLDRGGGETDYDRRPPRPSRARSGGLRQRGDQPRSQSLRRDRPFNPPQAGSSDRPEMRRFGGASRLGDNAPREQRRRRDDGPEIYDDGEFFDN